MTVRRSPLEECILGGLGGCGAGLFTNPLEVIKTRMQLQGELKAKGQYAVFYRNSIHAVYTVAKNDGILALQKGLVPALWYQMTMNGFRLGLFQVIENSGFTNKADGTASFPKRVLAGAATGAVGAFAASPFYMVKTQLQARAAASIAVGFQHQHAGMVQGLAEVSREHGVVGLWRGVSAAVSRVTIGSAVQLSTFSVCREYIANLQIFPNQSLLIPLTGSIISSVAVTAVMTPFDVVSTRVYNQGTDVRGKGLLYKGVVDCFVKIFTKEGIWGFYKGWGPSFLRLGPHTTLSLTIWDRLRVYYTIYTDDR